MAGKTFRGVGDMGSETPPLDPQDTADSGAYGDDGRPFYSGPTIVDNDRVEEGLRKLRDLDLSGVPMPEESYLVADDSISSDPTLIGTHVTVDHGRETAVGHDVSAQAMGHQAPADDRNLRGTMFGHDIHLPDIELARAAAERSAAMLAVIDPPSQPIDLGDFDRSQPVMLDSGAVLRADPIIRERVPPPVRRRPSRATFYVRLGVATAIALVGGGVVAWVVHGNGDEGDDLPRSAAATRATAASHTPIVPPIPLPNLASPPLPAASPVPIARTATEASGPPDRGAPAPGMPAPRPDPTAVLATPVPARAPSTAAVAPTPTAEAGDETAHRSHTTSGRARRGPPAADGAGKPRPPRTGKRPAAGEEADPDATMPPSDD